MLAFRKCLNELCNLKLLSYSNCRFKNSKLNIGNLNPLVFSFSFVQCSSFSRENKIIRIPLCEIGNLNINHLNFDLVKWNGIADEILQAKTAGHKLPEYLKEEDIIELIKCGSKRQRFGHLTFLLRKENGKLKQKEDERRNKLDSSTKNVLNTRSDNGHMQYGLGKNTLIIRARSRSLRKFYDRRLANAVLFGQKIVIDLGYDEYMWVKEKRNCVGQIRHLHNFNKQNRDPYNLYFCNAKSDSYSVRCLRETMPRIEESLVTLTEQSYLDIFPKEDLVYLSPHASEPLKTYDHKAIYIIGGFVDTVKRNPISLTKSQEEGIKSYFLPLDEHVLWGGNTKSLCINHVFAIMQTLRDTGDWKQAFKHVPIRKLRKLKTDSDLAECMSDKLCVMYN